MGGINTLQDFYFLTPGLYTSPSNDPFIWVRLTWANYLENIAFLI